jgi:hypothetical protein
MGWSMENEYKLYCHLFPNGKRYIGITKTSTEKRWSDGKGYKDQQKMARAIEKYGWDNIEHQIITDGLTREQAERLEMYLIDALDTVENGYNVSIGGNHVNGSYLNEHVLEMIRESRFLVREKGDVIDIASSGNANNERAKIINKIDEHLCENKNLWWHDSVVMRADGYWCSFWQMLEYGEIKKPYVCIRYDVLFNGMTIEEAVKAG